MDGCLTREHSGDASAPPYASDWPLSQTEQEHQHRVCCNRVIAATQLHNRASIQWAKELVEQVFEVPDEERRGEWLSADEIEAEEFTKIAFSLSSKPATGPRIIVDSDLVADATITERLPMTPKALTQDGGDDKLRVQHTPVKELSMQDDVQPVRQFSHKRVRTTQIKPVEPVTDSIQQMPMEDEIQPVRKFTHRRVRTAHVNPAL